MAKKKELSFEESLAALEEIVTKMETGEESLTELMQDYSDGVTLAKRCLASLERAEKTMDILLEEKETGEIRPTKLKIEDV